MKKKWYKSRTNIGAVLIWLSTVIGTAGGWINGTIEPLSAVSSLLAEIGGVFAVVGIRGWPVINQERK